MTDVQTRVRWNEDEKTALAAEMARLQATDRTVSLLDARRAAQLGLPEGRRRDIKSWSIVEPLLGPILSELRKGSAGQGDGAAGGAVEPSPEDIAVVLAEAPLPPVEPTADASAQGASAASLVVADPADGRAADALAPPAPSLPSQVGTIDTLRVEAALVAALESPVVEAALVKLFGKAMSEAFAKMSAGDKSFASEESQQTSRRVLLAGFGAPQAKSLEEALERFEVRVWKPGQSQQLFETLASICSVAVIPESTSDDGDESLKAFNLKVLRHEGSPSRLAERIEEVC